MKKFFSYVVMSLLALCFMVPLGAVKAEAAKVAIVPLMINVPDEGNMKGMLFSEACVNYFKYPAFDLLDSIEVKKAADAQTNIFSLEGMRNIANMTGADIVLAMTVDKFESYENWRRREETITLDQRGKIAIYNKITGKLRNTTWRTDETTEIAPTVRSDYPHNEFARTVRLEIKRASKI